MNYISFKYKHFWFFISSSDDDYCIIQYLAILCSLVIPALAACSLAAFDLPLSFFAAFSRAKSLWLPRVILKLVAELLKENKKAKSGLKLVTIEMR